MTKEKLEKEAYLYAKNSKDVQNFECGFDIAFKSYLASAEPREKRIAELEQKLETERSSRIALVNKIAELEAQIERMKSDVMANIKWADKNCDNMWQKLVKMWNQWEIKEND